MPYLEKNSYSFKYEGSGIRLDRLLHGELKDISREKIKKIIYQKAVSVNGSSAVKPSDIVREGDEVSILKNGFRENDIEPKDMGISVIYEDKDIAVINKPAGVITHPLSKSDSDTLINGLLFKFNELSNINGPLKPGIVHRLDKDTSGIMIIAKNNEAHNGIAAQFKNKEVIKIYLALVEGSVEYDEGLIVRPIGRSRIKRTIMEIDDSKGRPAETYFRVVQRVSLKITVKSKKIYTLIALFPKTGRTHQLRVHMKHYGHPIIGDSKYGKSSDLIARQALHAYHIKFFHPVKNIQINFKAPLANDFKNLLSKLGIANYNLILDNIIQEV
ncbi:MAG: RluA family pseudouridine synthase [Candidatus Kaelpia aquatica]|nr:RluA family pseudouridine synthase [Candidatus Kaelpia aquatica]